MIALLVAAALSSASVEAEIKAFARAFDDAQLRGDAKALETMVADDLVFIRGSGARAGKREFVATFGSGTMKLDPFVITDPVYVALGSDAGMVGGKAILSGTEGGTRFSERFEFTDTFHRRRGKWQAVHIQVTPTPAAN